MKINLLLYSVLFAATACASHNQISHVPPAEGSKDDGVEISVTLTAQADSVVVCPVRTSDEWPYYTYKMEADDAGAYHVFVPKWRRGMPYDGPRNFRPKGPYGEHFDDTFGYNIVVYSGGKGTVYPSKGHYQVPMR